MIIQYDSITLMSVIIATGVFVGHGVPIPVRLVDLTHILKEGIPYWAGHRKFEMNVTYNGTYEAGGNSSWFQLEEIRSGIHIGTHMDAPCHFAKGAWTMDEIPINRFIAPAAVVDITEQANENRDYEVTVDDLINWETETGQSLNETILLLRSGWSERWPDTESFIGTASMDIAQMHFPGLSKNASQWLVDNRNIYGIGSEAVSFDPGYSMDYWAHKILLPENIFGLENVGDLEELPLYGATLHVIPLKIASGSGAPTRIFASFPEITFRRNVHSVTRRSIQHVNLYS